MEGDKLNFDMINDAGQLYADGWPIYEVCVQTGLMKIDVCGKLDRLHWSDVVRLTDENNRELDKYSFYLENAE